MDNPTITGLSLCSGVCGLDIGIEAGLAYLGFRYRVLGYAERDGYAVATILARMADESLERAPIWSDDIAGLDAKPLRGRVGILNAGFPCQPFSVAGKQRGHEDERNVWPEIIRIIREVEPGLVFLENVPGLISTPTIHHRPDLLAHFAQLDAAIESQASAKKRWYGRSHRERLYRRLLREQGVSSLLFVKASLESIGYTVEDPVFISAQSIGASHRRERVFILAHKLAHSARAEWRSWAGRRRVFDAGAELGDAGSAFVAGRQPEQHAAERSAGANQKLARSTGGRQRELRQPSSGDRQPDGSDEDVGDSRGTRTDADIAASGPRDTVGESGGLVAHAECDGRRLDEQGRGPDRGTALGGTGTELEYAGGQRREARNIAVQPNGDRSAGRQTDGAVQGRGDVADPEQPGPQGERHGLTQRRSEPESLRPDWGAMPLFAPGPGADWSGIPEWLWPAIDKEASESVFRGMAHELAGRMDDPRADRLRCIGNGCVPAVAAAALVHLFRGVINDIR